MGFPLIKIEYLFFYIVRYERNYIFIVTSHIFQNPKIRSKFQINSSNLKYKTTKMRKSREDIKSNTNRFCLL